MKLTGIKRGLAVLCAFASVAVIPGCGDEDVDTACCQLLLVCDACGCTDNSWTIASSGEGKACKDELAEVTCNSSTSTSASARSSAEAACK
jgi:hypothetical protein